jgi:hypothetical protein
MQPKENILVIRTGAIANEILMSDSLHLFGLIAVALF